MDNNEIIDINYESVQSPKAYTIEEISKKIGVSKTKINHWIFKLNKSCDGKFFNNPSLLDDEEIEKLELAQGLLDDGMTYDEIINYFKENNKPLIDKENGSVKKDLNSTDVMVISKSVTQEVKRQADKIVATIKDEIAVSLTDTFKEEAMKIAQVSLEAMNQSKEEILNEVKELKNQNEFMQKEIERLYSKQTEDLRKKLKEKEDEVKELQNKKKGFFKWLKGR